MRERNYHETISIPAGHPALPGHFPAQPLVPGVVLLDRVIAAIEREWGQQVQALTVAKFLRPLLPGRDATMQLIADASAIRFRIEHDGEVIATGQLQARP